MADFNKDKLQSDVIHAGEYGNQARATRSFTTGVLSANDVVHLIRVPANTDLHDLDLFHGAAGGTSAIKAGYIPVDSANGAGDDDYFLASGTSVVNSGRLRANTASKPVRLNYPVDIVVTATAAFTSGIEITASLQYEWRGK